MVSSVEENSKDLSAEPSAKFTPLNCIDLSSPDIQNSVSLLNQVLAYLFTCVHVSAKLNSHFSSYSPVWCSLAD